MSLSLGNRSAVFFELENWKQCLSDIEVTKSFRFLDQLEYADDCFIREQSDFKIIYNVFKILNLWCFFFNTALQLNNETIWGSRLLFYSATLRSFCTSCSNGKENVFSTFTDSQLQTPSKQSINQSKRSKSPN